MSDLIIAIKQKQYIAAKELIIKGHDLDVQDTQGCTALMYCCSGECNKNHQELIYLLLEKKANPDIQDDEGYTALTYSFELNRPDINYKLIELTNLHLCDKAGYCALTRAVYHGREDLIDKICDSAKDREEVNEFRKHLVFENHSLWPYSIKKLEQAELYFTLKSDLRDKLPNKKKKI